MAFTTCEIKSQVIKTMTELTEYINDEKNNIVYLPLEKFIEEQSIFMDDQFYGRGTNWVRFNVDGFDSFCNRFNIPASFLSKITEPGLVSNMLNDYQLNSDIKEQMVRHQLVVDNREKTVLGVVSNTYVKYYNQTLIENLEKIFPKILKSYEISESYVINTNLHLRILSSNIKSGFIVGRGGSGEDISRVGLQISNSLVGNSSVNVCFFILRLLCANGLTFESFRNKGKVVHSGREETFQVRMKKAISPLLSEIKTIPGLIQSLMEIPFQPETIVRTGGAEIVYSIIALQQSEAENRKKLKNKKDNEELIEFDKNIIANYPQKYAGNLSRQVFNSIYRSNQSLFDFVNVFTEYAQTKDLRRKVEIEKRTGDFVKWILQNKKKLINAGGLYE